MSSDKIIKLCVVRKGNIIICPDLTTLGLVLGTKAIAGNLNVYNVKKEKGKYLVPKASVGKRLRELEKRKDAIDHYLCIIRQVLE